METPLISCVMATCPGREHFLEQALRYYRKQTYPCWRRELILVADTPETGDHLTDFPDLGAGGGSYIRRPPGTLLGVKLNLGVRAARGNFLVKLDDDDWYAPEYLERSLQKVLQERDPERVILTPSTFPIYIVETGEVLLWKSEWSGMGTGMLFSRRLWTEMPFREDVERGLDNHFIRRARFQPVAAPPDAQMLYVRHGVGHLFKEVGPESPEAYFRRVFKPYGKRLEEFMPEEDAAFYRKLTEEARRGTLRENNEGPGLPSK